MYAIPKRIVKALLVSILLAMPAVGAELLLPSAGPFAHLAIAAVWMVAALGWATGFRQVRRDLRLVVADAIKHLYPDDFTGVRALYFAVLLAIGFALPAVVGAGFFTIVHILAGLVGIPSWLEVVSIASPIFGAKMYRLWRFLVAVRLYRRLCLLRRENERLRDDHASLVAENERLRDCRTSLVAKSEDLHASIVEHAVLQSDLDEATSLPERTAVERQHKITVVDTAHARLEDWLRRAQPTEDEPRLYVPSVDERVAG
jgi:hypothetical protein